MNPYFYSSERLFTRHGDMSFTLGQYLTSRKNPTFLSNLHNSLELQDSSYFPEATPTNIVPPPRMVPQDHQPTILLFLAEGVGKRNFNIRNLNKGEENYERTEKKTKRTKGNFPHEAKMKTCRE